jgi:hypothetical protein
MFSTKVQLSSAREHKWVETGTGPEDGQVPTIRHRMFYGSKDYLE